MHLSQHKLCTRKMGLAPEVKFYLDFHWVTCPTNTDQRKWRQIRISAVSSKRQTILFTSSTSPRPNGPLQVSPPRQASRSSHNSRGNQSPLRSDTCAASRSRRYRRPKRLLRQPPRTQCVSRRGTDCETLVQDTNRLWVNGTNNDPGDLVDSLW